jgi:hypothetical protein
VGDEYEGHVRRAQVPQVGHALSMLGAACWQWRAASGPSSGHGLSSNIIDRSELR